LVERKVHREKYLVRFYLVCPSGPSEERRALGRGEDYGRQMKRIWLMRYQVGKMRR